MSKFQEGKNNSNYKDGRTIKKYFCKICNMEISYQSVRYGSGLCRSCCRKEILKNPENNPNYKGGVKCNPHYCKVCNKKISYFSWKYGKSRCRKCYYKDVVENSLREGKNNSNWNNGSSFEPYPLGWSRTFKEQIRYRDGYKCQLCGVPEIENGRKLDVHHKDYNKENLALDNLISLCRSCHSKTNFNREYWKDIFNTFKGEK